MSHEVENMMYLGKVPWHGWGTPVEEGIPIRKAVVASGLDWEVGLAPLCVAGPIGIRNELVAWPEELEKERVEHRAVFRRTDNSILGCVGPAYTPLQNHEAFDWFQPFLDAKEARLHTAGSLRKGKRVWILAEILRDPIVVGKDDVVAKYVLLSNSHDGTQAVRVGFTPIRVVCANTMAMAHGADASKLIRVRHRSGVVKNLEAIRDVMDVIDADFTATAEQYAKLATRDISTASLLKYVRVVMGAPKEGKVSTRMRNILDSIIFENFESDTDRTWWGAYNAVNRRLVWQAGKDAGKRLDSLWFGGNERKNARALQIAIEMASAI